MNPENGRHRSSMESTAHARGGADSFGTGHCLQYMCITYLFIYSLLQGSFTCDHADCLHCLFQTAVFFSSDVISEVQ